MGISKRLIIGRDSKTDLHKDTQNNRQVLFVWSRHRTELRKWKLDCENIFDCCYLVHEDNFFKKTSQTGDSAGFQVYKLENVLQLRFTCCNRHATTVRCSSWKDFDFLGVDLYPNYTGDFYQVPL
ncbi:hypothetical protein CLF_109255 [Clonorchis sinensis]|uniref:Uncharacterized protein n=1 Tax=Clonorchis sinensis TaxID=79923 RepID=G7YSF2_CLOSI|nr:hypothetical protein CLF_109255 [Clonorchis sinensis]